jgi:UPF0716 protein FxsA
LLGRLLLLFVLVPVLELFLLIEIGQWIGTGPTIALIILTGVLGAFLARRQGLQVLARLRSEIQSGQPPTDSIFEGVLVLVAGAFLMTPGVLTDIVGFSCLIPATRRLIKRAIWARLKRAIDRGQIITTFSGPRRRSEPEDVIIIDPDDYQSSN